MDRSEEFSKVREIAEAICDGSATDEQKDHLQKLIFDDPAAQQFYIEYMDMHARLKADSPDSVFELTMRRMQVEEITLRSGGSVEVSKTTMPVIGEMNTGPSQPMQIEGEVQKKYNPLIWMLVLTVILILTFLLIWQINKNSSSNGEVGVLSAGSEFMNTEDKMAITAGTAVKAGLYETGAEKCTFTSNNGAVINFNSPSSVELLNPDTARLTRGSISYKGEQNSKMSLEVNGSKIQSKSGAYDLILNEEEGHKLTVKEGTVSIIPKLWSPRHYWNLDDGTDRISDSAGEAHGVLGSGTKSVPGLVGKHAVSFDNTESAHIHVGSGGGTALGTGSFSVNEGITIEAMIKPEWSGEELDYDEIFRKDYDQAYRMLFSFQNDYKKSQNYTFPKNGPGPRLSFGLFLVGHKYQELEILLDGQDGRPELEDLKDGKAHHVAATYNSFTGRKAIFIDGKMVCHVDYPQGTRIISGGPGPTTIGNMPGKTNEEPFTGVIDEVAFYNFALTTGEIRTHYNNVQKGLTYFGYSPESSIKHKVQTRKIKLNAGESVTIDPQTGLILE